MADGSVKIEITGDDSDIKKKVQDTEDSLKGLGDKQKETQKETEKTSSKFEELANAIDKQEKELKDLKAEYIETAINLGKNSSEAQALKEKFSALNGELQENKSNFKSVADSLEDLEDSSGNSGKGFNLLDGVISSFVGTSLSDLGGKLLEVVGNLISLADETREYREDMAKLNTAFKTMGHDTEMANEAYSSFYKILGESDRSVEAANHLAELAWEMEDVKDWAVIAAGVTAKFGDSLPLEGLTEAANETAKVGQTTGVLADALNWASADSTVFSEALGGNNKALAAFNKAIKEGENVEDAFSAALEKMSTEQERSMAITSTLKGLYSDAAAEYNEMTAGTQAAREATNRMEQAQAKLGAAMEPVTTAWTNLKASALEWVTDSFTAKQSTDVLTESQRESVTVAHEAADAYRETKEAAYELALAQMADVNYATTALLPQLQALVDANGRVKQGYEERAAFLLGQFNEAMGTEYTRISEIIGKNGELKQSILDVIEAKKVQILLAPLEDSYKNAVLNVAEAEKTRATQALALAQQTEKVAEVERSYINLQAEIAEAVKTKGGDAARAYASRAQAAASHIDSEKAKLKELQGEYATSDTNLQGYYNDINSYQTASTLLMEGKTAEAISYLNNLSAGYESSGSAAEASANTAKAALEDRLKTAAVKLALLKEEFAASEKSMTEAQKTEMQNRISEAEKEVEALGTEAEKLGSSLVEGIGVGADGKKDWLSGKLGGIVSAAIEAARKVGLIASPSKKTRDEIGKPLAEGIGVGIDKNAHTATDAMGNLVNDVVNAAKEEADINSPSRVMENDVGKMMVRGLEIGIERSGHLAVEAMRDLGSDLIDEAIKAAEKSVEVFAEAEKEAEKKTKSSTSKTSTKNTTSTKKVEASANTPERTTTMAERLAEAGYKSTNELVAAKGAGALPELLADSREELSALGDAIKERKHSAAIQFLEKYGRDEQGNIVLTHKSVAVLQDGQQVYYRQQNEKIKQTEEANEKIAESNEKLVESNEKLVEIEGKINKERIDSLKSTIAQKKEAEKKIVVSDSETARKRVEQLRGFKSTYENQLKEINKLEEDYAANSKKIQEQLKADIEKTIEDYQSSFKSRAEGIVDSLSLFEKAEKGERASGVQMTLALKSQVKVLEDYKKALDELSKRDVNAAFIEEMSSLSVDALPQLEAFNKMTDAQLNEYVRLWEEKSTLANDATEIALSQQRERTKQEIQALKDTAEQESSVLYMEYNTAMFELLEQVSTGLQEIGDEGLTVLGEYVDDYVDIGKQLMAGVAEGLKQNGKLVDKELVGSIKGAMSKAKEAMGIHSPSTVTRDEIGKNLAAGVAVGWSEKLGSVKGKMAADMRAITDRIKTAVSLEQARMSQGVGVRDTGFAEVAQAVGIQTAGINSLASEYRRGSNKQITIPIILDKRELGRAFVEVGGEETTRTGTSLSLA